MSKATASAIVAPKERVIAIHVSLVRSRKRTVVARKSAKKSRSGRPNCAVLCSPGTGNVKEKVVKTCRWWVRMCFVGPRQTEYASTQGMITATSTTQAAVSK